MSDVFEVSYVFHGNDVGRLQTVTVDIKQIHSVDIVSIGIEIYILYIFNKIFVYIKKEIVNFGMKRLPQCSYTHVKVIQGTNDSECSVLSDIPVNSRMVFLVCKIFFVLKSSVTCATTRKMKYQVTIIMHLLNYTSVAGHM